ncbi:O-antigen ligase family protein [Sphingomonas sp. CFBP 13603]|uniref:O-antigen ligase family protein n=1 Tax=Sphingomonas sp. CFBP 13603 TaxID=2774040 RepID=UPI00186916BF|nr:O-antigen ligase family protein [Sphingomonas sp. CFBP 13603]MBE2992980.1 O-antigen ligase family protein [Sphingomonas sp. CFBP 13603]
MAENKAGRNGAMAMFRVAHGERSLVIAILVQITGLTLAGGGVTGLGETLVIAMLTMALLVVVAFNDGAKAFASVGITARIALAAIILLPLAQIIPLPPAIWQQLPGQALRLSAYGLIGIADTWQPMSLSPLDTTYTVLMAIAFVTLTIALLTVSREAQAVVLRFVFALIVIGLLIGVVQIASGGSALRVHDRADHGALIGFFSNKNHMALMLAASLPIAALEGGIYDRQRRGIPWIFVGYWGVVVIAILLTNSRAGVMLGLVATIAIAVRMLRDQPRRYLIGGPILILAIGAILLSLPQVDAVFSRFNSVGDDLRWRFAQQSLPLLHEYWLTGSGSGSFSRLYAVHENLLWVKPTFVNQLHDDFYQLAIEQGLAGVLLLGLTILSLTMAAVAAWRLYPRDRSATVSAVTIIMLFAFHSIVDYPLRRPATFPLLAMAFAIIWWREKAAKVAIEA